jgi:hypothetical protein
MGSNEAHLSHRELRPEVLMSPSDYDENVKIAARDAVVVAGAVRACPLHSHVTIRMGDEESERYAYALATTALKREGAMDARQDILDAIKAELDAAAEGECPECVRQRKGQHG